MAAVAMTIAKPAAAMPIALDYLSSNGYRLTVEFDPNAAPSTVMPRLSNPISFPTLILGVARYPVTRSALMVGGSFYGNVISSVQFVSRGGVVPGLGSLPDILEIKSIFDVGLGTAYTATVQLIDPTLNLGRNVYTDTLIIDPVNRRMLNVTASRVMTDTIVLNSVLRNGQGILTVDFGTNVITDTIVAIARSTGRAISEPSSLLIAIAGFGVIGFLARSRRKT